MLSHFAGGRNISEAGVLVLIGKLALWFTEISIRTWDVMTHLRPAASVVWTSVWVPFSAQLAGIQKGPCLRVICLCTPRLCAKNFIKLWSLWTSLGSAGFTGCNNLFRTAFKVANILSSFQSVFGQLTGSLATYLIVNRLKNKPINLFLFSFKKGKRLMNQMASNVKCAIWVRTLSLFWW